MREAFFAVPGNLQSPTGGYAYARRLLAAMPEAGWRLSHLALPDGFPAADAATLAETEAVLLGLPADRPLLIDGLAYGVLAPDLLRRLTRQRLALVHHPLALESGLAPDAAERFHRWERRALAEAAGVVVSSPTTAGVLAADFGVPAERITVAEPGTDLPATPAEGSGAEPTLICVATLSARKGQDTLVEALARIGDLAWRCRLIGSATREPEAARKVRGLIAGLGLGARVEVAGEVAPETMGAVYRRADLFVLPTRYEGYGMAFAEAMAHGLPIVACPTGAVPETVPQEAALFVPPDRPDLLADALRRLLSEPRLRAEKAAGAWNAGRRLPRWEEAARRVAAALAAVGKG